jgi:hypothetical protein
MNIHNSLNQLHQKIKDFHDIVKKEVFFLSECNLSVIKSKNESDVMPLTMAIFFLRNSIREMSRSNIKLKDFNRLEENIKKLFQKFVDTPELINFKRGEDLFVKLNEYRELSIFEPLYNDFFQEKLNKKVIKDKCIEIKENLINFEAFKERYKQLNLNFQNFEKLLKKFYKFQNLLNDGDLKTVNENSIEFFRLFRSFSPLSVNSKYVIDIENQKIVKLSK